MKPDEEMKIVLVPVDEVEELDRHSGKGDKREWSTRCSNWLYPGDRVVVINRRNEL